MERQKSNEVKIKEPLLLDIEAVAYMLSCSAKHIRRMRDAGLMPSPVLLGKKLLWNQDELREWVAAGCPRIRRISRTKFR